MGEKSEARETGEDLERKRAWEYSIEDNERWDKKMARKGRRADFTFTGELISLIHDQREEVQIASAQTTTTLRDESTKR